MTPLRKFLFGLAVIFLGACAPKPVTIAPEQALSEAEGPKARQIEPEARNLYNQAERAFSERDYDMATRLFAQVKSRYPKTKAFAYSCYRLGIIFYYKENYVNAAKEFEQFVTKLPTSELAFDATYNWAASEFQLERYDRANLALSRLRTKDVSAQGPRRAETVYQLAARIALATGNYAGVVAAHGLQLQLPLEEGIRVAVEDRIDQALAKMSDRPKLQQLLSEVNEPTTRNKVAQRLATLNEQEAARLAPPSASAIAPPIVSAGEQARIVLPSGGSSGQRASVGVLLPLSGRWATYGRRALDGILLASKVYANNSDVDFRLYIEDTESNPTIAQRAMERLSTEDQVMAVIGSLNWKESLAIAEKAVELGVPNLSLAPKEGLSEKGPYVFQNALTPGVQLESLVRYTINEKKFTRFAILAPNNGFGKDMANRFWDLVEQYGGKIINYAAYPPDEKDFQSYIREMTGLADLKFRRFEQGKLTDYLKEQKTKTGKEPKTQLPPIIDFDAIFIPDSPKAVAQIAPSLSYYDVTGVALLGTTEWNSDQFYKRGGKHVEGAIFPAGLHLKSRSLMTREFIKAYTDAYGTYPDLLAAQSFEAMELIAAGLKGGNSDRNVLANQLMELKGFETPLGNLTFDSLRVARRHLPVLTLEVGGEIVEH